MRQLILRVTLFLAAFHLTAFISHAQIGVLDTVFYKGRGYDFKCTGGLVLPDSSIIVTGRFFFANNQKIAGIARVLQDGSIDQTFNNGLGADEHVNVVARQSDGKLIIGGDFIQYDGVTRNRIARLNTDGTLDNTFNTGTGFSSSVYEINILSNGKILVGGAFINYNGNSVGGFVRLNPDGTLDNTFAIGAGANNNVYDTDVQSDGRIIVAGQFTTFDGVAAGGILRLHPDGTRDTTFKTINGGANNIITAAYLTAGDKIVIGGFFTSYEANACNRIARVNTDGTFDATFNVSSGFNNNVNEICIQPDGKVLATGNFTSYAGSSISRIARLNTDGTRDLSFQPGFGLNLSCNTVFMSPDEKIYVGGTFTTADSFARIRFTRLLANGKVDQTFNRESNFSALTNTLAFQSNGKMLVGGAYFKYNDVTRARLARFNIDGTFDDTFLTGQGADDQVISMAVLPNDKIIIAGNFTFFGGSSRNYIARLNADGSLDNTFIVGTGFNNSINKIAVDSLGRVYAGGYFTSYNGNACNRIARLNPDGSFDNTFAIGTGFNNLVWDLKVDANQKLVVVGQFTSYNGTTTNRLLRLNTNGTIDNTFNIGTGANAVVYCVEIADDGSHYIGGSFTTYNGTSKLRIARLTPNGSLDATYTAAANNSYVYNIAILPTGILATGDFGTFNGATTTRMAFTDFSGNSSSAFFIGDGANALVNSTVYNHNNRRVYLAGTFTGIQGYLRNYFAALRTSYVDITDHPLQICQGATAKVYIGKAKTFAAFNNMVVQLSDSTGSFANAINIGVKNSAAVGNDSINIIIPFSIPTAGGYRLRVVSTNPADTSNLSRAIHIGPLGALSITPSGPTTFCSGGSVTLNAPLADAYQWSNGATTSQITVSNTDTFSVSVTVNGCQGSTDPVSVTVNTSPDSSLTISSYDLCADGAILSAVPGYTYQWSTGGNSQTQLVTANGSYTVTVTSGTCSADSTIFVDFNTLTNNLIIATGSTTICQGQSVQLNGQFGLNYTWSTGATGSSITVNTPGSYSATANDGNCTKNTNIITVTVNSLPSAAVSAVGPDKLCVGGGTVVLQVSASYGYLWNSSQTTQSITATTAGNYTVTVTNTDGCSASGSYNVTVFAPTVSVTTNGNTSFCDGGSVQLTAIGGGNYLWSNNATTSFITAIAAGVYTVTVTDPASSCTVGSSNSITVTVNQLPNVSFVLATDTICVNTGSLTLSGGSPAGGNYSGTGVSNGIFNPVGINGNVLITYSVTDANNCTGSASDNIYVDVCAGLPTPDNMQLLIYPNPVENRLFIDASFRFDNVSVYDVSGKQVREYAVNSTTKFVLNLDDLSAGTYLLKVGNAFKRFMK